MDQKKNVFKRTAISLLTGALLASTQPLLAEDVESATADSETEKIAVVGRRISSSDLAIGLDEASNTVAVTREQLLSAPAGISGLKMLENLPGFNVQTDGALGLYEFGNSLRVRAFSLAQTGFVLDGIPMGRSDAFGGSPIFRYVDNENLGSVIASPGAGDVSAPSYSSLGPIASYYTIKPSEKAGGVLSYTLGEQQLQRSFIKLETGDINGFRAYASRSKTDSELWRGPGTIDREHIEGKALYEFGAGSYIQATYVSNDFFDYDSPSASAATFAADYNYGYLPTIPEGCQIARPGVYDFNSDGVINSNDFTPIYTGNSCTQYYEDRINIRKDKLYSLAFGTFLADDVQLNGIYYYEDKNGYGVSPDSYNNSLSIYQRQAVAGLDVVHPRGVQWGLSEVGGQRNGGTLNLVWTTDLHTVELGGWLEKETYHRTQLRLNKTGGSADGAVIPDEVVYYRRDYTSIRETTQLYLKDTIALLDDKLQLQLGIKALSIDYDYRGYRDFADYEINGQPGYGPQHITAKYEDLFLPNIGLVYQLTETDQLFASYAQNYALPAGTDDIYSVAVSFEAPQPKGEKAENLELGYRTSRGNFNAAIAAFYTTFDNRLFLSSVFNPATEQPEAFYINGGGSKAYGLELSGVVQPEIFNKQLYFNGSFSYNKATLADGFGTNPKGSREADSPLWLASTGITYEPTSWLVANISAKYTGTRYNDYAESIKLDSYTVVSSYLDIGGANNFGLPENVSLRFNIDNLFDKKVLSYVSAGSTSFRPLSPRTFQASVTVAF